MTRAGITGFPKPLTRFEVQSLFCFEISRGILVLKIIFENVIQKNQFSVKYIFVVK